MLGTVGTQRPDTNDVVADISTLSWVNMLLASLWPKANSALSKWVEEELTPRLQDMMPRPLKSLRFARCTLGNNVPELGPIEVMRLSDSHVQIELEMRYLSDVDVLLETSAGGMSFGISRFTFVGRLCLALKPLLQKWPVVGGVHVFFVNQPQMQLQYRGLAQVLVECPGVADRVQNVLDDFFRDSMVLPHVKSYHFTRDEQIVNLTQAASHPPLGVLRVRVLRGRNLAGAKWEMTGEVGMFTSNPFCVIRLGDITSRSSTVRDTRDPDWPKSEPSGFFIVYHHDQELKIEVLCDDAGFLRRNVVFFLGRIPGLTVRSLLARSTPSDDGAPLRQCLTLDTSQVKKHMLHVDDPVNRGVASELELEIEWHDLVSGLGSNSLQADHRAAVATPSCLLLIELHAGSGFPESCLSSKEGLRWRCKVDNESPACSRPGKHYHEEPDIDLPIHSRLYYVIDRLLERGTSVDDIADIVDSDPEHIRLYIQIHKERAQRAEEKSKEGAPEERVDLCWHQTLPLLVRRLSSTILVAELIQGENTVIGHLDAIPLKQLIGHKALSRSDSHSSAHKQNSHRLSSQLEDPESQGDPCQIPRTHYSLRPADLTKTKSAGGLSDWLFPSCSRPVLARSSYSQVRMEVSVQLRYLSTGTLPRAVGATNSDLIAETVEPAWPEHV